MWRYLGSGRNAPNINCTGARATWAIGYHQHFSARPVNFLFGGQMSGMAQTCESSPAESLCSIDLMNGNVPSATEIAEVSGQRVRLACMLGRDMMPGVDLDRRISVLVRLEAQSGGGVESGAVIDEVWLRAGVKVARRTLEPWGLIVGWPFGTKDGPDWDDRRIDVVAHVRDERGRDHYLAAHDQLVGYCW
jgi:hypothetical protein